MLQDFSVSKQKTKDHLSLVVKNCCLGINFVFDTDPSLRVPQPICQVSGTPTNGGLPEFTAVCSFRSLQLMGDLLSCRGLILFRQDSRESPLWS